MVPVLAEDLVNWLDEERAQREQLRADLAEFRQEMRAEFRSFSATIGAQFSAQLTHEVHGLETRLMERIHLVDNRVVEVKSDLMKWSFVFWVSAVSAIAVLAGVLR